MTSPSPLKSNELGLAVARAMGFPLTGMRSVRLDCEPGRMALLTLEYYVYPGALAKIDEEIENPTPRADLRDMLRRCVAGLRILEPVIAEVARSNPDFVAQCATNGFAPADFRAFLDEVEAAAK